MPEVPTPTPAPVASWLPPRSQQAQVSEPLNLPTREAAWFLGLGKSTLEKMRHFRRPGPPFIRVGRRCLYPVAGLRAWAQAQEVSQ